MVQNDPIDSAANAKPSVSDEEKAKLTKAPAAVVKDKASQRFVMYMGAKNASLMADLDQQARAAMINRAGVGTYAEVTQAQWAQAGITATHGHVWNLGNQWRIPAGEFTERQIDHLLTTQSKRFRLVDGNGKTVRR
ncbi:hypothetical protein [Mycobacterium canetti]|uniref:hypothetical protein n=1 Tax=Mycobacterium canetti TaxID=78331 RepID=UPI000347ABDB|nr:hypothetical protein [Mycobacterium canetti]